MGANFPTCGGEFGCDLLWCAASADDEPCEVGVDSNGKRVCVLKGQPGLPIGPPPGGPVAPKPALPNLPPPSPAPAAALLDLPPPSPPAPLSSQLSSPLPPAKYSASLYSFSRLT